MQNRNPLRFVHHVTTRSKISTPIKLGLIVLAKWRTEIETSVRTGTRNGRTETANTKNKDVKRFARGLQNLANYRPKILHAASRQPGQTQPATKIRTRHPHFNAWSHISLAFAVAAACSGGGDSLGNTQPWCPIAGPYIDATEELVEQYQKDARRSSIEEAEDLWDDAKDDLYSLSYGGVGDIASGLALEELYEAGIDYAIVSRSPESDDFEGERYRERKKDFENAKSRVFDICK